MTWTCWLAYVISLKNWLGGGCRPYRRHVTWYIHVKHHVYTCKTSCMALINSRNVLQITLKVLQLICSTTCHINRQQVRTCSEIGTSGTSGPGPDPGPGRSEGPCNYTPIPLLHLHFLHLPLLVPSLFQSGFNYFSLTWTLFICPTPRSNLRLGASTTSVSGRCPPRTSRCRSDGWQPSRKS